MLRNILDKYRKLIILSIDLILINTSIFLSFLIRFDWCMNSQVFESCMLFMICASLVRVGVFFVFGLYQWSFMYASISELLSVFRAVTLSSLILFTIAFFLQQSSYMGRSVLLIDYLICFFLISASRFLPRVLTNLRKKRFQNLKRIIHF